MQMGVTGFLIFFFKQKTAYEIGLGIPAEPLFRSDPRQQEPYDQYHENSHAKHWDYHKTPLRSEERFSRNAETDLVCRLLLEKKNQKSNKKLSEFLQQMYIKYVLSSTHTFRYEKYT